MRQLIFTLTFLASIVVTRAQVPTCNCLENLEQTIEKTEENYAGYPAKVNKTNEAAYAQLTRQLKQKAERVSDPKSCYYIIRDYVRFFKDKHFIFSYIGNKIDSTVVNFSEDGLTKKFLTKNKTPVEGIWISPDSTTKIAILKSNDGTYTAFKLESTSDNFPKGFVYFTLTPNGSQYIIKKFDAFVSTDFPAKQTGNLLRIWNHTVWGKIYPQKMTEEELAELSTWKENNNGLAFKKLSPDFAYLKVPSFYNNDQKIQKLVADNDSIIRSTKYLIVDLAGNGGGNTGWLYFLQYFMTNPIVQEPPYLRVTPDNVKLKLPELALFANKPISDEYKKYFPEPILNAYKKAYTELPQTKAQFYPIPTVTFPLDSITRYPEKIALVVDNFSGSSTEYFFHLSKQSKKTITYGSNTIGMMDYEGMSTPTPLPFDQFILTIPIAKSGWTDKTPIDQTGFEPDVIIKEQQNKWIEFIQNDLHKKENNVIDK